MFSMTSLQSQSSPLRTLGTFYQPKNRPHQKSVKKTYHQLFNNPEIKQLYNPSANNISIKNYLHALEKNKSLQRRPLNKNQFYSYISFRKAQHQQEFNNPQANKQRSISSFKMSTIATSRVESLCSILDKKRKFSAKNQLVKFQKQFNSKQQEVKDRLRFSFYNCNQKSKFILDKYNMDQSLDDRKTNVFQNSFNRKIIQDGLLEKIAQLDKKRRKGDDL